LPAVGFLKFGGSASQVGKYGIVINHFALIGLLNPDDYLLSQLFLSY
jgi:hypothetical protein